MKIIPYEKKYQSVVLNFVLPYEKYCCTLVSKLLSDDSNFHFDILVTDDKKIAAVIMTSKIQLCMHCIPQTSIQKYRAELKACIAQILSDKMLYCISGEKTGTEFIQNICWQKPKCQIDYYLNWFDPNTVFTKSLPENLSITKCGTTDVENLFSLQKQYEIVEVIPEGDSFNEKLCRKNLYIALSKQKVFAVTQKQSAAKTEYIAKAGTNACGINCFQLGGVFTETKHRGKGIASVLVRHISELLLKEKPEASVILFVKINNESAKAAYSSAGFKIFGEYKIVYYPLN
jgi:predicted GNAT family acetyltransferase